MKDHQHVLVISFRRTFSSEFAAKSGFRNYLDLETLDIRDNPKLVVQIDSLHKVRNLHSEKLLLVLDEVESILSHIKSFMDKSHMKHSINLLYSLLASPDV